MSTMLKENEVFPVSYMAEHLIGSEIIKLANEIAERIRQGEKIYNLTIGDFDPAVFPIPGALLQEIIKAYQEGHTNYPVANGVAELRKAVSSWIHEHQQLEYKADEILISGGARPLIYAVYTTLLDEGDKVIYPVPSWNNNHYCHLVKAKGIQVEATPETGFMPNAELIRPHISDATMLALCSPQNPTGTVFSRQQLEEICDLVLEENRRRKPDEKPLYLMYDQIYSALCFTQEGHVDPVTLRPELRPYTIYIDGLSKSFAATGIRVGWAFGPNYIIDRMKSILSHIGAWAPKAEQLATARFLQQKEEVKNYLEEFSEEIIYRLKAFYEGFNAMSNKGLPVRCIEPAAAIYLTVQFDLKGKTTSAGKKIETTADITAYLLGHASLAIVPFGAFGASSDSNWYRISIGTCHKDQISTILENIEKALSALTD